MAYETLLVDQGSGILVVTFNRLARRNSLNSRLLKELNEVLDRAEMDQQCRLVVLQGQQGIFCTGMDFEEAIATQPGATDPRALSHQYMATLKRLSLFPKVVVAKVEGQVMAGGVGLVAASDIAVATPESQFSLSEALWGLLPSMVLPYLIRRVGFQKAYHMTLTTLSVSAQEAHQCHLVDEVSADVHASVQRLSTRLLRLDTQTIVDMKQYFRRLWLITEEMEQMAVAETTRLVSSHRVRQNIENYVKHRLFPWETTTR